MADRQLIVLTISTAGPVAEDEYNAPFRIGGVLILDARRLEAFASISRRRRQPGGVSVDEAEMTWYYASDGQGRGDTARRCGLLKAQTPGASHCHVTAR